MFSYPKINNSPVVVQGNLPNHITHEKPSFLNVLNRPPERDKDKSTINTFSQYANSINIGKEDVMSQRSDSTSKFDMNKFKIGNKNDSKTFDNTIHNKSNYELASARQTINSGLRSPITQTIENNNSISYNNPTPQINHNIPALNISDDNIVPKKNNFSKYLINDSSQKENKSNNTESISQHNLSNLIEKENSLNNVNIGEQRNSIRSMDQSFVKTQQSIKNQNVLNNVINSTNEIANNNSFKQNVNNISKDGTHFKKNENDGKIKNNNKSINLQYPHEYENRRMTLELVK